MSVRFQWTDKDGKMLYEQFNPDSSFELGISELTGNIIILSDDKGTEKRFKVVPVED